MCTRSLSLVVLVTLAACGGKKKEEAPAAGSGSAVEVVAADAAMPANTVEIFVNDSSVATITPAQIAAWPRVDKLVPPEAQRLGMWMQIQFVTASSPTSLERPSANHPDKVPVLFPGEGGAPAFGLFDPVELAKRGTPAFRADSVREVRLTLSAQERGGEHQGSTGEATDPTKLVVKITTQGGDKQLTGAQILALPREPQPGNEDTKGWRVTQFLEAAGVKAYEKVVLIDASGTSLPYERKELEAKTANPFVKLNKQGALRFRMFKKQGEGWQPRADLRSLTAIQVK